MGKITDKEARLLYNKLAFLSQVVVDLCDKLEETTKPKRELKYHLKRANLEAQKVVKEHFDVWVKVGEIEQPDGTMIEGEDVYAITDRAYEYLFNKKASEVVVIADMVRRMDEEGFKYTDYNVAYKPLIK